MLKIINDTVLCGISVHPGEMFPLEDFDPADVQILVGAGLAEIVEPPKKAPETPVSETKAEETDTEPPKAKTPAKTAKKRKKA
jgi:hypothetical protein